MALPTLSTSGSSTRSDGTTNFIHGLPVYAVSIALTHRGVIQQAVV